MAKKLSDLPPSKSDWWLDAVKLKTELVKKEKCEHYFVYKSATEVVCENCPIGYYLTGSERIVDGKLIV